MYFRVEIHWAVLLFSLSCLIVFFFLNFFMCYIYRWVYDLCFIFNSSFVFPIFFILFFFTFCKKKIMNKDEWFNYFVGVGPASPPTGGTIWRVANVLLLLCWYACIYFYYYSTSDSCSLKFFGISTTFFFPLYLIIRGSVSILMQH